MKFRAALTLLALTTGLALGNEASAGEGEKIARSATWYESHRPNLRREDCSGLVSDILNRAGYYHMLGTVTTIHGWAKENGWLHKNPDPEIGDVVFFDLTYDSNKNGKRDDRLTHIAVVTSVDDDGTIHMVHRTPKAGIVHLRMNLSQPDVFQDGTRVLNDVLVDEHYARGGPRLTGQVWSGFATIERIPPDALAQLPNADLGPEVDALVRHLEAMAGGPGLSGTQMVMDDTPPGTARPDPSPRLVAKLLFGATLTERDIGTQTCEDLWWLRNATFARHGFSFTNDAARGAFEAEPWYEPRGSADALRLTDADRENIGLIAREEQERCE